MTCEHDWILLEYIDEKGYIPPDYPLNQMNVFAVYRCRLCGDYCEIPETIGSSKKTIFKDVWVLKNEKFLATI